MPGVEHCRLRLEHAWATSLEASVKGSDDKPVPLVLIVVEGGQGTIETVYNALIEKTPVILVKVKIIKKKTIMKKSK